MDFDFFKGFELHGSIKLGKELMRKIVILDSLKSMNIIELKFPDGHPDAGNTIEVYSLEEQRYAFAKDISQLIIEECVKILGSRKKLDIKNPESPSNPKVLSDLVAMILDIESTSFALG